MDTLRSTVLKHAEELEQHQDETRRECDKNLELQAKVCAMEAATIQMLHEKEKAHEEVIESKNDAIKRLQEELASKDGELASKDGEMQELGKEMSQLVEQIDGLQQEVKQCKADGKFVAELKSELAHAHASLAHAQANETQLMQDASAAAERLRVLEERLVQEEAKTKAARESCDKSAHEAADKLATVTEELHLAQTELETLRIEAASVGTLKARLHLLETQLTGHKPLEETLQREVSQMQLRAGPATLAQCNMFNTSSSLTV